MVGFVFLQREFLEWEWYQSPEVSRLYIHLLLKVNFVDKKWEGIVDTRGQLVTFLNSMSAKLKLSTEKIWTALPTLEKESYISRHVANYSNNKNNVEQTLNGLGIGYGHRIYNRLFEMFNVEDFKEKSCRIQKVKLNFI